VELAITAKYSGDSNHKSSVSVALKQVVQTVALEPDASNPTGHDLVVGGTSNVDKISIENPHLGVVSVEVEQLAGQNFKFAGIYNIAGVVRLVVYGGPGDNFITVQDTVTLPALLLGGQGNNSIKGGGGPSVLVGGPDQDVMVGALGPSILIGAGGADLLTARGGAVLIGGNCSYDTDPLALEAILAEWSRTNANYQTRVNDLLGPSAGGTAGGLNGPYYLNPTTLSGDGTQSILNGGSGLDLFFATMADAIFSKKAGDEVILV